MGRLTRALVWISGASSGIGAALAMTAPPDAEVIDLSRRGGARGAQHVAVDLADPADWPIVERDFAERLARFEGDRVVFIHCAGTLTPLGPAHSADTVAYTRNVLLNSAAAQVLGQAFLRAVAKLDCERHLVMLSSGAALRPHEGESSYCAGKAAIDQWVRVVGLEQQRTAAGCRVVSVVPGAVDTAMQDEIRSTDESVFPQVGRFREMYRAGGLIEPIVVAQAIWSLLDRDVDNGSVVVLSELAPTEPPVESKPA